MGKMLTILLAAFMGVVGPAWANQIVQYGPDYEITAGRVTIPIEISNNDNGAIYNSYDLSLFHSLAVALFALPQNQTNFASIEEMTATWQLGIRPDPIGEVNADWNATTGDFNPVSINNVGGIPGLDYEQWLATQQDPNQDMMALALTIPLSQLDGNGNGFSLSDPWDYHVTTNSVPTADMGVGRNGGAEWAAQGYEYGVVMNGDGKITQHEPDYDNYGSTVGLVVDLTNNDNGAIYNSYDISLFHSLAIALFALPQNQTNFASAEEMMGAWVLQIVADPAGEVNDGWSATEGDFNPVSIENVGGIPNVTYETWYATRQDPNQDMMRLLLEIPKSQLDGNGNGFSLSDPWDYHVTTNSVPTADMGVGHSGVFSYSAQGYEYGVVMNGDGKIVQYAPDYDNYGSTVGLVVDLTNNDNGAVYNSYELFLFHSLAVSLYALPQNQTNYASAEEMMGDWVLSIRSDPAGEVNDGWSATEGDFNPVEISNVGGIPGLDYEQWLATQQNPNQDMMRLLLEIPKSQLDGNGNGWSLSDPWDYHVTTNSVPTADMGVGHWGINELSAQGYEYGVVLNGDGKIVQYEPGYIGSDVEFNILLTNNDNGAIYNSYDLALFNSLAVALFALPQNQTNYASVEAMVADWTIGVVPGEVSNGWNVNAGNYNPVSIVNIDGDINIDYDGWYATQQDPNQDAMFIRLSIPDSQLDGNGNGWSLSDPWDYHVTTNSVPTADMGVGHEGITQYSAQGYEYGVVLNGGSEPATGRFEMGTMELGLPVLTIAVSPSSVTVIVQRCEGMLETNWQSITNLSPGTTQWTDQTATGAWSQLYYRLAK